MPENRRQAAVKLDREGQSLLNDEKVDEAIELFTQAIEADPNYALAYLNRSEAHRCKGQDSQADGDRLTYNTIAAGGRVGGLTDVKKAVTCEAAHELNSVKVPPSSAKQQVKSVEPSKDEAEVEPGENTSSANQSKIQAASSPAEEASKNRKVEGVDPSISSIDWADKGSSREEAQETDLEREDEDKETGQGETSKEAPNMADDRERGLEISQRQYRVEVRPFRISAEQRPWGSWLLNPWGMREALTYWTAERFFRTLLLATGLSVIGILIGKVSFCPGGVTGNFWTGCGAEMLSFALGGGLLGVIVSLAVTWGLRR